MNVYVYIPAPIDKLKIRVMSDIFNRSHLNKEENRLAK